MYIIQPLLYAHQIQIEKAIHTSETTTTTTTTTTTILSFLKHSNIYKTVKRDNEQCYKIYKICVHFLNLI